MSSNKSAIFDNENIENVQDNLNKVAKDLGKHAKHFVKDKQEEFANFASACSDHVKENPLRSVLLGFGAGFLVSKLLGKFK